MCNYEGCERENYVDSKGREWNYCIFHLPKGDIPEEAKEEMKKDKVERERLKELEKFLALDEEEQEEIREDFERELNRHLKDMENDIESGKEGVYYDFRGFWFHNCDFEEYRFKSDIYFEDAIFSGVVKFISAIFLHEASFEGAKFCDESYFIYTKFYSNEKSLFSKNTTFHKAIFLKKALFTDAEFYGDANFSGTIFCGDVGLRATKFSEDINLSMAIFRSSVDFSNILVSGYANFKKARFSKNIVFMRSKFLGNVDFILTEFKSNLDMRKTTFSKLVFFVSTKFFSKTDFRISRFESDVYFENVEFLSRTLFDRVSFLGDVKFKDVMIDGTLSFQDAVFYRNASFEKSYSSKYGIIYFKDINIENKLLLQNKPHSRGSVIAVLKNSKVTGETGEIRFIDYDMSRVLFLGFTDINRCSFSNVKFPILHGRNAIFDEPELLEKSGLNEYFCGSCSSTILIEKRTKPMEIIDGVKDYLCPICGAPLEKLDDESRYEYLASAYEALRENYESKNRHVEAGDFYIGEMEARKKWLKYREKDSRRKIIADWGYRQLINLYKAFSLYGESTARPLLWILFFGILFGIIFVYSLGKDFWTSIYFSFLALYQTPPPEIPLGLASLERGIGLFFNTLLILTLNRKFRRKGRAS